MVFLKIAPRIYVGCVEASKDLEAVQAAGITHMLMAADGLEPYLKSHMKKYLQLSLYDDSIDELLPRLPKCMDFIDAVPEDEAVLVYCVAGCSRSVSVCIAYLMYKNKTGFQETLSALQEIHESASPNDLFMKELELWEKMGCTLIGTSEEHRRFKMAHPEVIANLMDENTKPVIPAGGIIYACRHCRKHLFTNSDVLPHNTKEKGRTYNRKAPNAGTCTSIFIETMEWMGDTTENVGKIACDKCKTKLGTWSWHGMQCSCGVWESPAFQICLSKLDRVPFGSIAEHLSTKQAIVQPQIEEIRPAMARPAMTRPAMTRPAMTRPAMTRPTAVTSAEN